MDISILLAKVIGLYLVITFLALIYNRHLYERLIREFSNNIALVATSGALILIIGLFVVMSHNIWTFDWRGLITLIGWLTIVKGATRLFFPEKVPQWGHKFISSPTYFIIFTIFFVIGLYLTYVGFLAS